MSDMLSIAASGLKAYQTALGVVSDNIANASTAGYSRRTTDLADVSAAGTSALNRVVGAGLGVVVNGVNRLSDDVRSNNVRTSGADLAKSESSVQWLQGIDTSLSGSGLSDALTSFFTSSKAVAADPSASAPRSTMLEAATSVANAFTATGNALTTQETNLDATAEQSVSTLNGLGKSLAAVNNALSRTGAGTATADTLADQRDTILQQMSAISDVTVSLDSSGRATVKLGSTSGPTFVDGNSNETGVVTYNRNNDGAVSFVLLRGGGTSVVSPSGGALAGVVDGAGRIAAAKSSLDTLASNFVAGVNSVQASGQDLNGNTGAAMFTTDGAGTVSVSLTDPRGIAAAGVGGGTRDNSNLANLDALRTSGNYENKVTDMISANGAALSSQNTVVSAQTSIHTGAVSALDAVSGVNLDDEAIDLMRFQQAYQASSKVIQVARDTFQSIISIN